MTKRKRRVGAAIEDGGEGDMSEAKSKGEGDMSEAKSKGRPKCSICGMRKVSGCTACVWYYCGECAVPPKKKAQS